MKKFLLTFLVLVVVAFGIFFIRGEKNGEKEINNFADCVAAGNPVMESHPRQCRAGDKLFVEDIANREETGTECTENQRNVDACIEVYQPVCAIVNIQCIKAPCEPIKKTYSNSCKACSNSLVSSYKKGECK